MRPKIASLALLAALCCSLAGAACGGSSHEGRARSLYHAYRAAEDARTNAEEELRLAFRDISAAAQNRDRAAVVAAAGRGQNAVEEIDRLITAELEAAQGLQEIDSVAAQAKRLADGLGLTRQSLALVAKELEIALDDPFLETRKQEVDDLAKESTDLVVRGELAIRRADRALALALGLEPRPDRALATTTG